MSESATWQINTAHDGQVYLKEKIQVDKYTFSANKYDFEEQFQDKNTPMELDTRLIVSMEIPTGKTSDAIIQSKNELQQILDLITLQTGCTFQIDYYEIRSENEVRWSNRGDIRLKQYSHLSKEIIRNALEIKAKIEKFDKYKKYLLTNALNWYSRGKIEEDDTNSFVNFWIGFESLSYWFGEGESQTCPRCGFELPHSKIRGRIKKIANKLSGKDDVKIALELYDKRNDLFHNAEPVEEGNVIKLKDLLKKCLLKILEINVGNPV